HAGAHPHGLRAHRCGRRRGQRRFAARARQARLRADRNPAGVLRERLGAAARRRAGWRRRREAKGLASIDLEESPLPWLSLARLRPPIKVPSTRASPKTSATSALGSTIRRLSIPTSGYSSVARPSVRRRSASGRECWYRIFVTR